VLDAGAAVSEELAPGSRHSDPCSETHMQLDVVNHEKPEGRQRRPSTTRCSAAGSIPT